MNIEVSADSVSPDGFDSLKFVSNDGIYFAVIPPPLRFSSQNGFEHEWFQVGNRMDAVVLELYANGNLIRQYNISHLVQDTSRLAFTATMIAWSNGESFQFNAENNTLSVTTADDITYMFDITTGEIINYFYDIKTSEVAPVTRDNSMTIVIIALTAVVIFINIKRKRYAPSK